MDVGLLSDLTDGGSGKKKSDKPKLTIFKFDRYFHRSSQKEKEAETKKKIICLIVKDDRAENRRVKLQIGRSLDPEVFSSIRRLAPDYVFFGVDWDTDPERIKEEFSDATPLDKFLESLINDREEEFIRARHCWISVDHSIRNWANNFDIFKKGIKNQDSAFLKRMQLFSLMKKEGEKEELTRIFEMINGKISEDKLAEFVKKNPQFNSEALTLECEKNYPFIKYLNFYGQSNLIQDVISYINLIDEQLLQKEKEKEKQNAA
jgi:hypothetical protein